MRRTKAIKTDQITSEIDALARNVIDIQAKILNIGDTIGRFAMTNIDSLGEDAIDLVGEAAASADQASGLFTNLLTLRDMYKTIIEEMAPEESEEAAATDTEEEL